ncbi:hypothetical protein BDV93DRAFT_560315 [Ceratobasidium sp. AG-I]|nr:hypothetical protein BDV93DRAFT_560315 [Ceratobasidium sp. AG-I]
MGPTCDKFLNVLLASPMLFSLELTFPKTELTPPLDASPVNLPNLKIIWLIDVSVRFVKWLLESIMPDSGGLTLALDRVADDNNTAREIKLLCSIPGITKVFYVSSVGSLKVELDLSGLLKSLTRLETLAFKNVEIIVVKSTA